MEPIMKIRSRVAAVVALSAWALTAVSAVGRGSTAQTSSSSVTIIGSVVDASLTPVPSASVALERGVGTVASTVTGTEGAFRFAGVVPGAYRVRVQKSGFTALVKEVRVPTGAETLRLPLVLVSPGDLKTSELPAGREVTQPLASPSAPVPPGPGPVARAENLPVRSGAGRGGAALQNQMIDGISAMPLVGGRPFPPSEIYPGSRPYSSGERYASVEPGRFHRAVDDPLSTFGADVDTASFANVRRFLRSGQLPPAEAVRAEEFVNYFRFAYPTPRTGHPIGLTTEVGECPWAPSHKLVLIGARAVPSSTRIVEGRNIVLLVDVSGSMSSQDKLPLVKSALSLFVDTLAPDDRLAIVTYAGTSGVALPSTPARDRQTILAAISNLNAGGSTNGGQGIIMAYRVARQAFIPGGVNRVILATDGDFNVGIVGQQDLLHLIEREKASGVFLSVFGVGTGNLQDATMEMLADRGNGTYSYLDSLQEARRVLVHEAGATLETVAKDVKFQVEFNPARVTAWKLVGYENRVMAAEDFSDDRKDGGELGAGHSVTVLYEVIPAGVSAGDDEAAGRPRVDALKYQASDAPVARPVRASSSAEWLTVKVRYQLPEGEQSRLITLGLTPSAVRSGNYLPFASAVAEFALLLRNSGAPAMRWDALARRMDTLVVPPGLETDRDQVRELVGLARGLKRIE
jgi:Ca-activated chloride channel family protein